jgi:hypothetical protein
MYSKGDSMCDHEASNADQDKPENQPQVWEVDEADSKREYHCAENPPKKWYFKPILPQVEWKEIGEILALVAAFSVCVIYWNQLEVMSDQLRGIQGSSSQTSQLIINAAHQAEKTKDVAEAASRVSSAASAFSDSAKGIELQTQSAVLQFQRLADSAKDSLKTTQDSFRDDQRAWIGILRVVPFSLKAGEPAKFSVIATNTGRTPAVHSHTYLTAQQIVKGTTLEFRYPSTPGVRSNSVVVPGGQVVLGPNKSTGPITKDEIDNITSGISTIYVYGRINYEDVFDRAHQTTFCYVLTDTSTAIDCDQYNEAD